jgi:hypothetical protein
MLAEAEPGMVLAGPTRINEHGFLTFSLPVGHVLTDASLRQLAAHGAECLFVTEQDPRSDEQVATDAARAAHRVMEIFSGADLSDPVMAALFDQVLAHRSA